MREICGSCGRPQRVCLCAVIPSQPFTTRTRIIILQHPYETRHKLATVGVVARCLSNCEVFVGRKFRYGMSPLLDECSIAVSSSSVSVDPTSTDRLEAGKCTSCGRRRTALLLFPTSASKDLSTWWRSSSSTMLPSSASDSVGVEQFRVREDDSGITHPILSTSIDEERFESVDSSNSTCRQVQEMIDYEVEFKSDEKCEHVLLLIVDGTWQHAKEMVKASMPFLGDFVFQVSLPHDISQEGAGMGDSDSILRKEPFAGCVSTMEAIARALLILEPDGSLIQATLLRVLEHMVKMQTSHFNPLRPRPRLASRKDHLRKTHQTAELPAIHHLLFLHHPQQEDCPAR
ncbi:hypothetical protein R1sor_000904 [Riccia sorocarpa]|uniref:tRNA-uridine aminocarboxypropyltransferase n=1 Tax=Riccia sorocarpa TaxID=122646 RepID=A0ABD3GXL4_9MARC